MSSPPPAASSRPLVQGLFISIVLNAIVPVLLYRLTKRAFAASELTALSVAALFPLGVSIWDVSRSHTFDPVALLSLMSILVSMIAVALGGSTRLLLIRESLFTGAFGIACLVSLAFPRPIMFYFGRHFTAGRDPGSIAEFNAGWQREQFRRVTRVITVVWGATSLGEFLIRIGLVYTMPAAAVLVVSPIIMGGLLIATIGWTFAYVRRERARREQRPPEQAAPLASLPRVYGSGVVWALVYNLVWGLAWFTVMRREWVAATVGQPMPWSTIWIVWAVLSILLGLASMAHVRNRIARARDGVRGALAAAGVVWVPLTLGMVIWARQASVSPLVAWLDSFVNLVALLAGSLAGLWVLNAPRVRQGAAP